jgi:hypothetical protein
MIETFDTLEAQMAFVDEVTRAGVRVKIRSGLEVEVPDDYRRGKTSAELTDENKSAEPEPEPEPQFIPPAGDRPEPPPLSATRHEWADYAASVGVDTEGLTKAEIQKLFEE